jgi:nucleoside-diphosphate-sugar epimerase
MLWDLAPHACYWFVRLRETLGEMKIGVIGATGFVGRSLCARLIAEGRDVVPIVRTASDLSGERVCGDIDGSTDWSDVLGGIDLLVHAAARVHVMREHAPDAMAAFRAVNRDGTINLARQAAARGVRRFIFLSTIKVNGEATAPGRPFRADDSPEPTAPYAISKLEAEVALREIAASSAMEAVIIRPPLVYGKDARGNFKSMARWIRRGIPLPLGSVGGNARSLVAIDNLADLITVCLAHPEAAGETFLVSDGRDVSTAELLRGMAAAMGRPARLLRIPVPTLRAAAGLVGRSAEADRLLGNLQVDIAPTKTRLGWWPPITLDEGLRRALA